MPTCMHVVHRASRWTLAARDVKTLHRVKAGALYEASLTVECAWDTSPPCAATPPSRSPDPSWHVCSSPDRTVVPSLVRSFVRSFICDCSLIKYPVHTIEGVYSFVRSFVRSFTFAQLKASTAVYARFIPYRRRALVAVRQSGAPEMEKLKSKADISP